MLPQPCAVLKGTLAHKGMRPHATNSQAPKDLLVSVFPQDLLQPAKADIEIGDDRAGFEWLNCAAEPGQQAGGEPDSAPGPRRHGIPW
jgi:hypothetical protein